jgi:primosomal protein N' (replication factor Y)
VTLVGVINADTALHFPDFRAAERTFQLVTQVAGRTGRGERGGRVLVQTFSPDHPAIVAAMQHDYHRFAEGEIPIRQEHGYPPFCQMVRIIMRGESETMTEHFGDHIGESLRLETERREADVRILGPAPAPLAKLRGKYRFHLLLVSEQRRVLRDILQTVIEDLKTPDEVQWVVDVDPGDML